MNATTITNEGARELSVTEIDQVGGGCVAAVAIGIIVGVGCALAHAADYHSDYNPICWIFD